MTEERIVLSILISAALVLGVVGCKPEPLDDSDAGVGGSTTGGSATGGVVTGGAAATAGTAGCPGTGGPSMVRLPEGYCIDSTEVTRAEYAAWLATSPSTAGQIPDCTWNTTFQPDADCMSDKTARPVCQTGCDNHPQVCVDWCDAYAYCKEVGKRLCGKIGGGSNAYSAYDYANPNLSQWYNACTSHNPTVNTYQYGTTFNAEACYGGAGTVEVGTLSACQSSVSGYTGVYDLSGNAYEWEDSCSEPGQWGICRTRRGPCAADSRMERYRAYESVGLRCCADAEGSGTGGTGGADSGACTVPEQSAPPFTTTLRFTNPGPDPRWLWFTAACRIEFAVTSCSEGYQRNINVIELVGCHQACPSCSPACEQCQPGGVGVLVAAGSYHDVAWNGYDPVPDSAPFGDSGASCGCLRTRNAPAGLYRVSVPVWTSDPTLTPNGTLLNLATIVTQDFTLDHAGGIVEVRL